MCNTRRPHRQCHSHASRVTPLNFRLLAYNSLIVNFYFYFFCYLYFYIFMTYLTRSSTRSPTRSLTRTRTRTRTRMQTRRFGIPNEVTPCIPFPPVIFSLYPYCDVPWPLFATFIVHVNGFVLCIQSHLHTPPCFSL